MTTTTASSECTPWPAYNCPEHHEPLGDEGSSLRCSRGHSFDIVRQIPRFVPATSYADAFGAQWNRYRLTQLDSHTGVDITTKRARRCLGEELWHSLTDKTVLEVGCGAGRFTEVLLSRGARVTSVDLSSAVEANRDNFPVTDRHRVAQANAVALPFAPRQFDVVFCLGVIQHTPSPEATIRSLFSQVRPGGHLVIDHYRQNISNLTKVGEPLVRAVLKRISPAAGIRATEALVRTFLPLHKAVRKVRPAQMLLSRFSPVRVYYQAYPELDEQQQVEWAMLDTHDSLTSWYRHTRTNREVQSLIESMGGQVLQNGRDGLGIEIIAKRTSDAAR